MMSPGGAPYLATKRKTASRPSSQRREKDVSLQVMVPASIKRQVSVRAAQESSTQRTIVLTALRALGFEIAERDLQDKRKAR
jgi:hypothetical protein